MPDSKLTILQRLEAGEITAEEAMALINRLNESSAPSQNQRPDPADPRQINPNNSRQANDDYGHQFQGDYEHHDKNNWIQNLTGWVGEMVDDISDSLGDMDIRVGLMDIFGDHHRMTETFTSSPVLQNLAQLNLNGKNDKIEIHAYDGDCVQIQCTYDARHPDCHVDFHDENGCISLLFEDKAMRSVRVMCRVPRVRIGQLHAHTKNAQIHLADINAEDIQAHTKNDKIIMESVTCKELTANTRNAGIKARAVSGANILLETTNAKITVEDIRAGSLNLKTTNAGIKTAYLDVAHLTMKTTNSGLKLEDAYMSDGPTAWDSEHTLEAHTTNGNIRLNLPSGMGLNIDARTTSGKIACDVPLYWVNESSKTHLKGESMDYAASGRRLKANLSTTNASVKILGM